MTIVTDIILAGGVTVFGLFKLDPALLAFGLAALLFGGLNLLEFKKFW
ncbi:MAG: hypothetical protein V3U57_05065 [Robiginitomaculum sp.]